MNLISSYRKATNVKWSDAEIDRGLSRFREAADALKNGGKVTLTVNMGSCQCGNHYGDLSMRNGVVWAKCHGRMDWQRYDGIAYGCGVAYGWGNTASLIAAIVEGKPIEGGAYNAYARVEIEEAAVETPQ